VAANSYRGQEAIDVKARPAEWAKQESDYGRRAKGYVYGAVWETTGACWTHSYPRRIGEHFVDFLCSVDEQIPAEKERIYALMDHLDMHHSREVLLFLIHQPRWEFVYHPKYAAYVNLIEPWWKLLRSRALTGRRFEPWEEVVAAVEAATTSWNMHTHPCVWGKRRRHQPPRCSQNFSFNVKGRRI
jgi:hypothetical protein